MKKSIKIEQIIDFLKKDIIAVKGDINGLFIDNIVDVSRVNETSLDWVNPVKQNKQEMAEASKARVILVDEGVSYSDSIQKSQKVLIILKDPKTALAKIGNEFFVEKKSHVIHPTAIIDPRAKIGQNVNIGPYCIIGNCIIGDNTFIDSDVKIYDGVQIGEFCIFWHGSVVGSDSIAYQKDDDGNLFHFPQLGGLIIGHHVEVGIYAQIDRGALSDTIVGNYVKLDNRAHISHNNKIGNNVVLAGSVGLAGSVTVGDNTWISPRVVTNPGLSIGKDCFISTASVINKNVPDGEMWAGNPARKICMTNMMNQ